MIGLTKSRILLQRAGFARSWSSAIRDARPSSHHIRKQFLDFFVAGNEHTFVRSSPVVPFCDPTVAFVNAGMNQFKNVFLGTAEPRFLRVANTQKCVRVGGKHNDLSVVGEDGYHHTFFEMMGNWSFGNYFKREACEYAWHLLTGPYGMDPNRLFVTYFGGDAAMGLEADVECREIWRSIGVRAERILPFGAGDNFWEMGATGPCGPCTEIHYDHCPSDGVSSSSDVRNRAKLVNAGLPELTEIWNLVFIQYNRNADKVISPLPQQHVDTGMGMERLTAVLQNATSNYTTDLFLPIFDQIQKTTNVPPYEDIYNTCHDKYNLYSSYRVVADHARMITACLSDGMFPDQNHKLRRVIRRVFAISDRTFASPDLLSTVIPCIVESLGPTYPEMMCNQTQLQAILSNERATYRSLMQNASGELAEILAANPRLEANDVLDSPAFVPAFREFQALTAYLKRGEGVVSGEIMFKMYDTFGLREETVERLAEVENLQLDTAGFKLCLAQARGRTKGLFTASSGVESGDIDSITNGLAYTENELKYNYRYNWATREYMTPRIRVKVLGVQPVGPPDERLFEVVLDQSAFYPEGGGQESDQGTMVKEKNKLVSSIRVESVRMGRGGVLVHSVRIGGDDTCLEKGDWVELVIDNKLRTAKIFNHTATHLLNACVKRVTNSVTYQKSSTVTSSGLKLELAILGKKVDSLVAREIQDLVQSVIDAGNVVRTHIVDAQAFYTLNGITRIPGEVYPDRNVRIVSIVDIKNGISSREPCCGTHAANSREIEYFCITNVRHTGRGAYQFSAVTGRAAKVALELGENVLKLIASLRSSTNSTKSDEILKKIQQLTQPQINVPHHVRLDCQEILHSASKLKREMSKATLRELVESEIQDLLTSAPIVDQPFLVHLLSQETTSAAAAGESVPLQRATKLCSDRPLIVACLSDGCVRARCTVPKRLADAGFSAEKWLQSFATALDGHIADAQKGQNPNEIAVMKARKVQTEEYNRLITDAVRKAEQFAVIRIAATSETPPVRWSDKG